MPPRQASAFAPTAQPRLNAPHRYLISVITHAKPGAWKEVGERQPASNHGRRPGTVQSRPRAAWHTERDPASAPHRKRHERQRPAATGRGKQIAPAPRACHMPRWPSSSKRRGHAGKAVPRDRRDTARWHMRERTDAQRPAAKQTTAMAAASGRPQGNGRITAHREGKHQEKEQAPLP